ncbi:MAG: P-II family nitrogen regulator [Clostridium sp.]
MSLYIIKFTFLSKVEIKIVVVDDKVDELVKLIVDVTRTGELGDGKIFITDIAECIRIRTGESGKDAIS